MRPLRGRTCCLFYFRFAPRRGGAFFSLVRKEAKAPSRDVPSLESPSHYGGVWGSSDGLGVFCRGILRWCAGLVVLPTDSYGRFRCGAASIIGLPPSPLVRCSGGCPLCHGFAVPSLPKGETSGLCMRGPTGPSCRVLRGKSTPGSRGRAGPGGTNRNNFQAALRAAKKD